MPAKQPRDSVDSACQLELFDEALAEPHRAQAEPLILNNKQDNANVNLDVLPTTPAEPSEVTRWGTHAGTDRAVLKALEGALANARTAADDRPPLVVLASLLGELGAPTTPPPGGHVPLRQARDDWLRRLETQQKSESTLVGYRVAIDDLLDWSETNGRDILSETAIVDYLHAYQERAQPAAASYYRRFVFLRKFVRWSAGASRRCSSAAERAASRVASLYRRASRVSCGGCAPRASPNGPTPSSAGSRAGGCRRRSSPTSSVAPRSAPRSRSTSPRTRCAIPR